MINNLIIISGIPGSGKTTLALEFEKQGYILIDDPVKKPELQTNKKYVITDPRFCLKRVFVKVNNLYPKAYWIFIKSNPIASWDRVQKRLIKEPHKVIKQSYFLKLASEFEANLNFYQQQTFNRNEIKEFNYGLV